MCKTKKVIILFILLFLFLNLYAYRTPIKVMTFNIHHGTMNNDYPNQNLDRIAAQINLESPDLVALIEVDNATNRSAGVNQAEYLARRTNMYYYFCKDMDYDGGEFGNAILSKYPIDATYRWDYGTYVPSALGAVAVWIDGEKYFFYVVHLARYIYDDAQEDQMRVIIDKLENFTPPDTYNVIVAGDFNNQPYENEMRWIGKYLNDASLVGGIGNQNTIENPDPESRFDYIFVDPDASVIECRVMGNPYGVLSDHCAVVATLNFFSNPSRRLQSLGDYPYIDDSHYDVRYSDTVDLKSVDVDWRDDYIYFTVCGSGPGGKAIVVYLDTDVEYEESHGYYTGGTYFSAASNYPLNVKLENFGADYCIAAWNYGNDRGWINFYNCSDPENLVDLTSHVSTYGSVSGKYIKVGIPLYLIGNPQKIKVIAVTGDTDWVSGAYDAIPNSSYDSDGDTIPDESDRDTSWNSLSKLNLSILLIKGDEVKSKIVWDNSGDVRYGDSPDLKKLYVAKGSEGYYFKIWGHGGNNRSIILYWDNDNNINTGLRDFYNVSAYPCNVFLDNIGAEYMIAAYNYGNDKGWIDLYSSISSELSKLSGYITNGSVDKEWFEIKVPYSLVPQTSAQKIIVVSADTDSKSGAYDALPNSGYDEDNDGIPDESDINTPWNEKTYLDNYILINLP